MTGTKGTSFKLWDTLSSAGKWASNTSESAIIGVLNAILNNKLVETAFKTVMLGNNAASMYKNVHGRYAANTNDVVGTLLDAIRVQKYASEAFPTASTLIDQALTQPNLAGIPISTAKVETNKEVEISESVVIIQSKSSKAYQTDNAVPRLKEWTLTGYLTSLSPLDTGLIIKPSLNWQIYYLNTCADSRRPVLFKTNRGEFVKVQITNLHTTEEASYNNNISVTISLKEYNPYTVEDNVGIQKQAIRIDTGE